MSATLKIHEYRLVDIYPWVHYRIWCPHGSDEAELRVGSTPRQRAQLIERLVYWMRAAKGCDCGQDILDRYAVSPFYDFGSSCEWA